MASGSRSNYNGSDGTFLYECDVCKYMNNKTSEAISFCTVCTEYMCYDCDRTHKTLKASRDHKLVTGSNMPSTSLVSKPALPIMYCENHKSMTLNDYCVTHGDVICDTCKLTDHRKCKTTDVTQQTKRMKVDEAFDQTMKRLTELKKKYEKTKRSRQGDKRKVSSEKGRCLDDLQNMRSKINNLFDQLETELTKGATDVEEGMVKEIDNHVAIMDDALNQINGQLNSLDQCGKSKDDDVMFVGMIKADTLQKKYEETMTTIEQEMYPIQIEFKPNNVITDTLMQLQSIGSVQTRTNTSHIMPRGSVQTKTGPLFSIQVQEEPLYNAPPGKVQMKTDASSILPGSAHKRKDRLQNTPHRTVPASKDSFSSARRGVSLKNMIVGKRRNLDVGCIHLFDCAFIGDGCLVLACDENGLNLLDKDFKVQSHLSLHSCGVASVDKNNVIITQGIGQYQLRRVRIFPKMATTQTIKVDKECHGIDIFNHEIYLTCYNTAFIRNGEVRILSMEGQLLRRLGVGSFDVGGYLDTILNFMDPVFFKPKYIKVSPDGSRIYVSDWGTGKVKCLNQNGRVLYQYADVDLSRPSGMYVDDQGTVLVCGGPSHNVHMINPDGKKHKVLLSKMDGVKNPLFISYRENDGCLMVGLGSPFGENIKSLLICDTKME